MQQKVDTMTKEVFDLQETLLWKDKHIRVWMKLGFVPKLIDEEQTNVTELSDTSKSVLLIIFEYLSGNMNKQKSERNLHGKNQMLCLERTLLSSCIWACETSKQELSEEVLYFPRILIQKHPQTVDSNLWVT